MSLVSIIIAIILFSVIVIFHELGHFLLAKANGIRVNEFCLGLGPTIIGFGKGETKYSIKLLPFGGACVMNAGAYGGEMKDVLESVTVLTGEGEIIELGRNELELGYRTSVIAKKGYIVLGAVLKLERGDGEKIKTYMDEL